MRMDFFDNDPYYNPDGDDSLFEDLDESLLEDDEDWFYLELDEDDEDEEWLFEDLEENDDLDGEDSW